MRAAERKSTEECPVKMKLVAPPLYVLTTNVRMHAPLFCLCHRPLLKHLHHLSLMHAECVEGRPHCRHGV